MMDHEIETVRELLRIDLPRSKAHKFIQSLKRIMYEEPDQELTTLQYVWLADIAIRYRSSFRDRDLITECLRVVEAACARGEWDRGPHIESACS